ncbi:MAG: AzlC family ABC transporter permease [Clostridia bacterium]|nr:AzlC family ABC transporter permease [Clostridia bacterium]
MKDFLKGLKGGIPIGLGYLSVSFAFGIMAISLGFEWWQAVLISMTNLTSAGQLAGIGIMIHPAQYLDMLLSQLTINIRYSFMSVSLSQKVTPQFSGIKRWILGFFMTDEIFAVASNEKEVSVKFFSGLTIFPYIGWTLGTLLGSVLGNVLPAVIMNALCIAIYGMFVAIVVPSAKESKSLLLVVGVAILLSCLFYYLPVLNTISSGIAVCICAIVSAVLGAIFFPVKEEENG